MSIATNANGGPAAAGRIVLVTTLAAAAGGISSVCLEKVFGRAAQWDVSALCNGILAGLVSITAGCATVHPWAALAIGVLGACIYRCAARAVLRMRIDDPLDAFAVHGACGVWGVISCALLSVPTYAKQVAGRDNGGLFYGSSTMLGATIVFVLAHAAWVGSLSFLTFTCLSKLDLLRVPRYMEEAAAKIEMQQESMDDSVHLGEAYEPAVSPATQAAAAGLPSAA